MRVAYLGDGNNVAHSLMEAGALAGMHVVVGTPAGFEPDPAITDQAAATALAHGGSIAVVHDPVEAVTGAHAVYTDVWVSMGDDEAQRAKREEVLALLSGRRRAHAPMPTARRSSSTACPPTEARRSPPT